jgi:hypothetical protein
VILALKYGVLLIIAQMRSYRVRNTSGTAPPSVVDDQPAQQEDSPAWTSVFRTYELSDMFKDIGGNRGNLSIEDELEGYTSGTPSSHTTNPIQFWQVRGLPAFSLPGN